MVKNNNTEDPKTKVEPSQDALIEIEDQPLSTNIENAKITASYTSPPISSLLPIPSLFENEETKKIELQPPAYNNGAEERNLTRHQRGHFREDPVGFMVQMGAFYQGTGWRSYRNYVGTRILYEGYTEETKERVLNSERVRYMITYLAEKQISSQSLPNSTPKLIQKKKKVLEKELQAVANAMVDKLMADLNSLRFIRFFGFFLNNMLARMYHRGIYISDREFMELRRVAIRAAQNSQSLIILPCHKSHIDYFVISWIFFRLGLALPHITAGDNLDLPIVGSALRRGGAFFIRRSWGDDQLYTSIVKEYIEGLLERGHNIECFIEGTRSRTGKLLPPKLGVLKIMLDCILSGRAKDCWIVPMSIQYDKVIESETFANELLGNPKERESLWGVITNTRLLQLKWGQIDIRFSKPYSLQSFIQEQIKFRENKQVFDPANESDKIILLKALGYRVLSDINSVSVIMPTALVGTVILTLRGRGVGRNELIRRVNWLKSAISEKGGRVADFANMTPGEIVDRAITVLKDLIKERKELLEPVFYAEKRFELSFYRNQVMHMFVSEAILSAALYTKIKMCGAKTTQRMHFSDVLEEVIFLSQLLKGEFIYHPGKIKDNLKHTIQWLQKDNVFVWEDNYVELSDQERTIGRENYDFYCFLIWPFIETYWLAAVSLFSMTPTNSFLVEPNQPNPIVWFNERDFHKKCQLFGKTLYFQGDLSYFESVNKETLKNAFIRYEEMGIIMVKRSRNAKIIPAVALSPEYVPTRNAQGGIEARGKLWDLVERIGKFRREGKNRRDNATVSSRVLRLAEMAATLSTVEVVKFEAKL